MYVCVFHMLRWQRSICVSHFPQISATFVSHCIELYWVVLYNHIVFYCTQHNKKRRRKKRSVSEFIFKVYAVVSITLHSVHHSQNKDRPTLHCVCLAKLGLLCKPQEILCTGRGQSSGSQTCQQGYLVPLS